MELDPLTPQEITNSTLFIIEAGLECHDLDHLFSVVLYRVKQTTHHVDELLRLPRRDPAPDL
jgi:hypothetical protein